MNPPVNGHHIVNVPLDQLAAAPRNPKRHDLAALRRSIQRFGYATPALRDERTGRLVVGHGRTEALAAMHADGEAAPAGIQVDEDGSTWLVPVVHGWASRSDAEAEAYLLADNRLTELGDWDDPALSEMLNNLARADATLVEAAGWDLGELDDLEAVLDEPVVLPPQPTEAHYAHSAQEVQERSGTGSTLAARGLTEAVLVMNLDDHGQFVALVQRLRGVWGVELSSGQVALRAMEVAALSEGISG